MRGLKERCQRRHKRVAQIRQRRGEERQDVSAVTWIAAPESYVKSNSEIHVHVGIRRGTEACDYCAIFYRSSERVLEVAGERADVHFEHFADCDEQWGEAMFVAVVEVFKEGQIRRIPSLVRLRLLKRCVHGWREFALPDLAGEEVPEVVGVSCNGESAASLIGRGVSTDVDREPVPDVVKRGAKVVDALADWNVEPGGGRRFKDTQAEAVLACLRVAIHDQIAWVSLGPPVIDSLYRLQVLVCSCELRCNRVGPHLQGEPIGSGSKGQRVGSAPREGAGEATENCEVGVQFHAAQPTDAERQE